MIVTYLSGYETLLNLTHVCTHWRHVITTCPTFWTDIRIGVKGMIDSLANLSFERADGCLLDVQISPPAEKLDVRKRRSLTPRHHTIPTLSPGRRIRTLCIESGWVLILEVLDRWADALSSLQLLDIATGDSSSLPSRPTIFFGDALTELRLHGIAVPGLDHIRAPNLTALRLWDDYQPCSATKLFDFLEAAPALEEVSIKGNCLTAYEFPPPNRTVTLPHVRSLMLMLRHARRLASHLVCPSLTDTRLADAFPVDPAAGIFPPPFHQLLGRCSVEIIDRVTVGISEQEEHKECFLQLRTPSDAMFTTACITQFVIDDPVPDDDPLWTFSAVFDQTLSTLLTLPLANVVTFTIDIVPFPSDDTADPTDIVTRFAEVFKKCPTLHEVVLEDYPLDCLSVFSRDGMPPIQVLIIKHPEYLSWEELAERVTEVAQIRHSRGAPLERIEVVATTEESPRIERLESWVQQVRYRVEPPQKYWRQCPWS